MKETKINEIRNNKWYPYTHTLTFRSYSHIWTRFIVFGLTCVLILILWNIPEQPSTRTLSLYTHSWTTCTYIHKYIQIRTYPCLCKAWLASSSSPSVSSLSLYIWHRHHHCDCRHRHYRYHLIITFSRHSGMCKHSLISVLRGQCVPGCCTVQVVQR